MAGMIINRTKRQTRRKKKTAPAKEGQKATTAVDETIC